MPADGPVAIILAAGQGSRMRSSRAKVLHEACGLPLIRYVVDTARAAGVRHILVVVGVGADEVRAALAGDPDVGFAVQADQRGTGHAVKACREALQGYKGPALVLVGDEPLLRPEGLSRLLGLQKSEGAACVLGTAEVADPTGFGRILRDTAGGFLRIIEQRDCTPEQARIAEINPSCYVFELPLLWDALDRLGTSNAQGEEYLTDAPAILQDMGHKVVALRALDADEVLGVNTRQHLAQVHEVLQRRIQDRLMTAGVSIVDPRNTYIDGRAEIGPDTTILPFTVIQGRVRIGRDCRVGPFTHLRDGTVLDDRTEVGAFVEVNRSHFAPGARARHLAYLGDAELGPGANIGAGAITANFDGHRKHPTEIGPNALIGAGSVLIAPVEIGEGATVGAGAVVTGRTSVAAGTTVVGVPARSLDGERSGPP
jgi:bifunctional UDP-N-acetylglucosamine pyrophosphorylase/glucosamine-1-phosphate N-acetyltransferase